MQFRKLNHPFYNKERKEQNRIFIVIAIGALTMAILSIMLSVYLEIYLIGILTCVIIISLVAPFFDMPSLKKTGRVTYFSPLFITENPKNGRIIMHGGTLFDYYFVIDREMNGKQRTDFILQQYLSGLLFFLEAHKNEKRMKLRGTSYIINERTPEKIGFKVVETDVLQKIILTYNYFNILISYSIAKNKIAFPKLNNTKTFEAEIGQLLERREYIEKLNESLKRARTNH